MAVKERISRLLSVDNILPIEKLQDCMEHCLRSGEALDHALVMKGYLTEKQMLGLLSQVLELKYLDKLKGISTPASFVSKVPIEFARNHYLVGFAERDGVMEVATAAPLDLHPMDEVSRMLDCEVVPVLATRAEIVAQINKSYQQGKGDDMVEDSSTDDLELDTSALDDGPTTILDPNAPPVIKLVNGVLFQALRQRASDIHIQPAEDKLQVRYRIDGILYDRMTLSAKLLSPVVSRIKVMGKMDIAQHGIPLDGRASIKLGDSDIDVRISSLPSANGERIVMRLLDKSARLLELEELGLDPQRHKLVNSLLNSAHGIVFVTGPTGSGKTTTLYAALKKINSIENNVITIEDPIEYKLPNVSQTEVNVKRGYTFAMGLRSIVRQDPDIIMVGEVRDLETAEIAVQAALTGHLVFSTLHTNDAAGAVTRLLDLGVEPFLVSSALIGVVAQRLVRLICKQCKEEYPPTAEELADIGLTLGQLKGGVVSRGRGCSECLDTGYHDRCGIYEVLPLTNHIRQQIMSRTESTTIKADAVAKGLRTLRMDGAQKVINGETTIEEVLRVTQMDVM
ncbi:MAG: Flp pilus assembly complex ATPase component TadA [Planctomycetes bacterium]|nr:Flp pilus assembly complex ATPase component TadA [Planctomycetota bacterium]